MATSSSTTTSNDETFGSPSQQRSTTSDTTTGKKKMKTLDEMIQEGVSNYQRKIEKLNQQQESYQLEKKDCNDLILDYDNQLNRLETERNNFRKEMDKQRTTRNKKVRHRILFTDSMKGERTKNKCDIGSRQQHVLVNLSTTKTKINTN